MPTQPTDTPTLIGRHRVVEDGVGCRLISVNVGLPLDVAWQAQGVRAAGASAAKASRPMPSCANL